MGGERGRKVVLLPMTASFLLSDLCDGIRDNISCRGWRPLNDEEKKQHSHLAVEYALINRDGAIQSIGNLLIEILGDEILKRFRHDEPAPSKPTDPRIVAAIKDRESRTDRYGDDLVFQVAGDLTDDRYVERWMPEHKEGCDLFQALPEDERFRVLRDVLNEPEPEGEDASVHGGYPRPGVDATVVVLADWIERLLTPVTGKTLEERVHDVVIDMIRAKKTIVESQRSDHSS
jgi:hypothetical protein